MITIYTLKVITISAITIRAHACTDNIIACYNYNLNGIRQIGTEYFSFKNVKFLKMKNVET